MLVEGYEELMVMVQCRNWMSGSDGGFITPANNYLITTYPWASFHFIASLESAMNIRLRDLRHLTALPQWIAWSRIRGVPQLSYGRINADYDFGVGDTGNTNKLMPVINTNPTVDMAKHNHCTQPIFSLKSRGQATVTITGAK